MPSMMEYQNWVVTKLPPANIAPHPDWFRLNWAMGLAGESGEYVDAVKKAVFHGKDDESKQLLELGDVLFYVAAAAQDRGWSLEYVALMNQEKLDARYPNGWQPGGGIR